MNIVSKQVHITQNLIVQTLGLKTEYNFSFVHNKRLLRDIYLKYILFTETLSCQSRVGRPGFLTEVCGPQPAVAQK